MGMPPGPPGIPEFADMDLGPTKAWLLSNEDAAPALYEHAFGKRPAEELYDLGVDPDQLGPVNTNWPDYVTFQVWNLPKAQYERIAPYLPLQRGNVRVSNRQVLNAILYVAEQGCKWRGLPARFGTGTPSTPE